MSQSSIAAGVRRVEALRDKQLDDYLKNKEKISNLSAQKDEENIKDLLANKFLFRKKKFFPVKTIVL